jgi:hypothetical protein
MVSNSSTPAILAFQVRVRNLLVARECLRLSTGWIMIWAAVAVGLRAILAVDRMSLAWGAAGLLATVGAGVVLARRKVPSTDTVRAVLDGHGALGGLLMAAGEGDIGRWGPRVSGVSAPVLRWRGSGQGLRLTASIAFLLMAFLVPDRSLVSSEAVALQVGGEVQKLNDQLQVLKEEQIVPPEKADVLEKDIERVGQDASGKDPAKTLEAVDHLEQAFRQAAAEASQSAIKQTETASGVEELAQALQKVQKEMDPQQSSEAMKELARLAQQAAAENKLLADGLSDELKAACGEGELTEAQLAELVRALKECKDCQRGKIAKLVKARLVDAAELKRCDNARQCDEAALADLLCQCKDGKRLAEALLCERPGRGGVTRGRADAAMTWTDPSRREGTKFQEKVLPPGPVGSLKESRLVGVSAGDPTAAKPGDGSTGGSLDSAQSGGGEGRSQTILPEHEKTVQRYFDRGKK